MFVLSDIKCMAAFPEEAQAAEETGALEGIPEELSSLWNENYMQEITDYLDDAYGKNELDTGKLWREILAGNLKESIREFGMQAIKICFSNFRRDGRYL